MAKVPSVRDALDAAPIGTSRIRRPARDRPWMAFARRLRRDGFFVLLPATAFVLGILWAMVTPLWQTPDELAHFGYVQSLGERAALFPQPNLSRELATVYELSGMERVVGDAGVTQPFVPGSLRGSSEDEIISLPRGLRDVVDPTLDNPAAAYPPGYYLLASLVYRMLNEQDTITITFGLRIFSALLTAITVLFNYLTLRLFFKDPGTARTTAFLIALSPMYIFMGMAVNVEVLVWLFFSVYLYLMMRVLRDGLSIWMNVALGLVVGLGLLVKQTFLVGIVFYVILVGFLRLRRSMVWGQLIRAVLVFSGVVVFTAGWVYASGFAATSPRVPTRDVSLGGFFLHFVDGWRSYRWVLQETFWGSFGWLDTPLSQGLYAVVGMVSVVALLGFLWFLVRGTFRKDLPPSVVFFFLTTLVFAGALAVVNYVVIASGSGWFFQGRYLFPMMAPIMALLITGLTWKASPRLKKLILLGLVGAMVLFHTVALFNHVIPRYYL